jgi:hypothetical protein
LLLHVRLQVVDLAGQVRLARLQALLVTFEVLELLLETGDFVLKLGDVHGRLETFELVERLFQLALAVLQLVLDSLSLFGVFFFDV